MGQFLRKLHEEHQAEGDGDGSHRKKNSNALLSFPDLNLLPPEISLSVLSHLNATDLCLAACVWQSLANDDILWMSLCHSNWGYVSAYKRRHEPGFSYRKLYLKLDEGSLTFNANARLGMDYFLNNMLVEDNPKEIARFLHSTKRLQSIQKREFLKNRQDILDILVQLQNYENQFLPNALRRFFGEIHAPEERGDYLSQLVDKFSERFCTCNPDLGLSKDVVFVVCFSLILLSVDLCSPSVKNKMSKREFIRNTRRAVHINDDFAGHLYDNIYLIGHVAPQP
ncbi:F-box only protein 8 [Lingula anatina]|uniref:F-box only protein 8 n=1 Tax=Lingula anatina TaxID=7574 RepID=A0A1S3K4U2_LINAN|nr:F-box only protein 8 [Lingula anatina]XP_013417654.1 F-box only protein 8 [Lingula anatina]|eukprot:XP_013417653.1 F-box only protein 8 [Lingula anatina]